MWGSTARGLDWQNWGLHGKARVGSRFPRATLRMRLGTEKDGKDECNQRREEEPVLAWLKRAHSRGLE